MLEFLLNPRVESWPCHFASLDGGAFDVIEQLLLGFRPGESWGHPLEVPGWFLANILGASHASLRPG